MFRICNTMKETRYNTLGKLTLPILIYESVDEGDKAAGKVGAMLEGANDNFAYRGPLAEGRDIITEFLEEESGIERKTKDSGKKDKDNNPILVYDEKQTNYVERVATAKGWTTPDGDPDLSRFQAQIDKLCRDRKTADGKADPLAVDAKARERKPAAPKKLAAKYLDGAKALAAGPKFDKFVQDVKKLLGKEVVKPTDDKSMEQLGWLVKEFLEAKEKQQLAALVG